MDYQQFPIFLNYADMVEVQQVSRSNIFQQHPQPQQENNQNGS